MYRSILLRNENEDAAEDFVWETIVIVRCNHGAQANKVLFNPFPFFNEPVYAFQNLPFLHYDGANGAHVRGVLRKKPVFWSIIEEVHLLYV